MLTVVIPVQELRPRFLGAVSSTLQSIQTVLCDISHEVLVIMSIQTKLSNDFFSRYPTLKVLQEEHSSHSGALNTGLKHAQYEHILVLNPGDRLICDPEFFRSLFPLISSVIYSFNVVSDSKFIGNVHSKNGSCTLSNYVKIRGKKHFLDLPHQGLILPKTLDTKLHEYSCSFDLRMDYNYLANFWHHELLHGYIFIAAF